MLKYFYTNMLNEYKKEFCLELSLQRLSLLDDYVGSES